MKDKKARQVATATPWAGQVSPRVPCIRSEKEWHRHAPAPLHRQLAQNQPARLAATCCQAKACSYTVSTTTCTRLGDGSSIVRRAGGASTASPCARLGCPRSDNFSCSRDA
jgi:hypothetical protein